MKMVPASVRCIPLMRTSFTTKGSKALALNATMVAMVRSAYLNQRIVSAIKQPGDIVIKRESHEHEQYSHADLLTHLHGLCRHRTSLSNFNNIIHQMPPIQ